MSQPDTGTSPSRDRAEVRRHNLHLLLKDVEKEKELAERAGIEPSYLSQIKSGRPAIGEEIARRLETAGGKASGWMDEDRRPKGTPTGDERSPPAPSLNEQSATYKIKTTKETLSDLTKYVLDLHVLVGQAHAAQSRGLQILTYSIAKQTNGATLLTDLKEARERIESDEIKNSLLTELLGNMIQQVTRHVRETK